MFLNRNLGNRKYYNTYFFCYVFINAALDGTAVLRVAGSIPALNKYLYEPHFIVPGLSVNAPMIQE